VSDSLTNTNGDTTALKGNNVNIDLDGLIEKISQRLEFIAIKI